MSDTDEYPAAWGGKAPKTAATLKEIREYFKRMAERDFVSR